MMENGNRRHRRQLTPEEKWELFLEATSQQLAQQHRRLVADEREPWRDAPPRDQHATTSATDRLLERQEVGRTVDQHLNRVARTRRRSSPPTPHKYPPSGGVRCAERSSFPSRRAW